MNIKNSWIARALIATALSFPLLMSATAAPVVIQKGSIAGYVYIPGTSVATGGGSGSGSSSTLQNCYYMPLTDVTVTFTALPASMFPISVDYKMVGGGGGFSTWNASYLNGGGGGGGGSSAIVKDGVLVAAAAGGKGADQGAGAGNNGSTNQGSFTIDQANSIRFIVGGGGGSVGWSEGMAYQSTTGTTWTASGAGGGAGYFGGGGGGGGWSNTGTQQGKGGGGGGATAGVGGAMATQAHPNCVSWSCYWGPGYSASGNNGGNGYYSSTGGLGAVGLIGGTTGPYWYYYSGNQQYVAPAGSGGGFGSGGGVGFAQTSGGYSSSSSGSATAGSNGNAAPFLLTIGQPNPPAYLYNGWISWGTNDYAKGGISSLALNQNAGAGGDFSKKTTANAGQIVLRYSAASCNLF
ncbi:hypothetical protein ABIC83_002690 [Roseateles asaccharophilus]|uniref:hypothetical protein n=1 Tax=Roseateles asaccharophilus TaxID=582607 RepID=UPI003832AD2F